LLNENIIFTICAEAKAISMGVGQCGGAAPSPHHALNNMRYTSILQ